MNLPSDCLGRYFERRLPVGRPRGHVTRIWDKQVDNPYKATSSTIFLSIKKKTFNQEEDF
jgi:hypothetical protein